MDSDRESARKEFVTEAEELLDSLLSDLSQLEAYGRDVQPDVINKMFRAVHSLKGLAGMLGFSAVSDLAHLLEETLDRLRMGRIEVTSKLTELLSDAFDGLRPLIFGSSVDTDAISNRIRSFVQGGESISSSSVADLPLDPQTRRSLTEYEEHRLIENVRKGRSIFSVQVRFDFADFDERLRELTALLSEGGEIISTLPGVDPQGGAGICFRLLYGTENGLDEVRRLAGAEASLETIQERPKRLVPLPASDASAVELTPTVRVDIEILDRLLSLTGELVIEKNRLEDIVRKLKDEEQRGTALATSKISRELGRKLRELQQMVVDIRMVPISQLFSRIVRAGRKLSRELGKEVEIFTRGEETQLDKRMIEQLVDPVLHLIRNSLDHGIEDPQQRLKSGKPAEGRIQLTALQSGNSVVIEVSDDGQGIDLRNVEKTAREHGLIEPADQADEQTLLNLLFAPGFSTSATVTDVSGRGVGLDVVQSNIQDLRGSVQVITSEGAGSTFRITLPITLATTSALIVRSRGERYAIPLSSMRELVRIQRREITRVQQKEVFVFRDRSLPLLRLGDILGRPAEEGSDDKDERSYVLITGTAERQAGILVDEVEGQQEILIKSIGERLRKVPGIAGATELGEDQVTIVLDTGGLIEHFGGIGMRHVASGTS